MKPTIRARRAPEVDRARLCVELLQNVKRKKCTWWPHETTMTGTTVADTHLKGVVDALVALHPEKSRFFPEKTKQLRPV